MWVFTTQGYFSAVAHKNDKELIVVRSRALQDSEGLAAWVNTYRAEHVGGAVGEVEVVAYQSSDYPWRVIITKQEWGQYLANEAASIDYTNYKDEVTRKQGRARHDIYARVWSALLALSKLPGAMTDHGKRAVPHPLYGKHRWYDDPAPSAKRDTTLWDAYRWDDADDDEVDDQPWPGDPGHEDCTEGGCESREALVNGVFCRP